MRIGVLALQGDFEAHGRALEQAGAQPVYVRQAGDLENLDGLVLPGGESTTMLKLLRGQQLFEPLRKFGQRKPMFGTCAGVILMASEVSNPPQDSLGLLDLSVERNAYGRQVDSRIAQVEIGGEPQEAVFIRAPIIRRVGDAGEVLAEYQGSPVLVRFGRHMAATFHPELSGGSRVHGLFLEGLERGKHSATTGRTASPQTRRTGDGPRRTP